MDHLTFALSENAFARTLEILKANFRLAKADSTHVGPIFLAYDVAAHLENGTIDLGADGLAHLRELDLKWDRFKLTVGLDLPRICVGGWCIDLGFFGEYCLPEYCIFEDDPDVSITADIAALVRQEVSFSATLEVRRFDLASPPPAPPFPWMQVVPNPTTNAWQVFLVPGAPIDIDLFDLGDVVGDLLEDLLVNKVGSLIPGGWLRDLFLAIMGSVVDFVRWVLDLPDDLGEWISDMLNVSLDLFGFLLQFVGGWFASFNALYSLEDPYPVLPAEGGLIPVRIPVLQPKITVDDHELTLAANIG